MQKLLLGLAGKKEIVLESTCDSLPKKLSWQKKKVSKIDYQREGLVVKGGFFPGGNNCLGRGETILQKTTNHCRGEKDSLSQLGRLRRSCLRLWLGTKEKKERGGGSVGGNNTIVNGLKKKGCFAPEDRAPGDRHHRANSLTL